MTVVPDYLLYIKEPMDFGTIAGRVRQLTYPDLAAFGRDVQLVFDNCLLYNKPDTPYWKVASRLKGQSGGWIATARERYEALLTAGQEREQPPFARKQWNVLGNLAELEHLATALHAVRHGPPARKAEAEQEPGAASEPPPPPPPHKRRRSSALLGEGISEFREGPSGRRSARVSLSRRTLASTAPAVPLLQRVDLEDSPAMQALLGGGEGPVRSSAPSPRRLAS